MTPQEFQNVVSTVCTSGTGGDGRHYNNTFYPFCFDVKLHDLGFDGKGGVPTTFEALLENYKANHDSEPSADLVTAAINSYEDLGSDRLWEYGVDDARRLFIDDDVYDGGPCDAMVNDKDGEIFSPSEVRFGFVGRAGGWLTLEQADEKLTFEDRHAYKWWLEGDDEYEEDPPDPEYLDKLARLLKVTAENVSGNKPSQAVQDAMAFTLFANFAENGLAEVREGRFRDLTTSDPVWVTPDNRPRSVKVWTHISPEGRVTHGFGEPEARHLLSREGGDLYSRELVYDGNERHYTNEENNDDSES